MLEITTPILVYVTPPASGSYNMAFDDWMLDEAVTKQVSMLRVYRWKTPTLSLGYFQKYADIPFPIDSVVRRRSGGGAILHHHEITYSFATPMKDNKKDANKDLYLVLRNAVNATLSTFGINLYAASNLKEPGKPEPFLCFERHTDLDLCYNYQRHPHNPKSPEHSYKIVGSAQFRKGNTILQHGSILLSVTKLTTHLPGLKNFQPLIKIESEPFAKKLVKFIFKEGNIEITKNNIQFPMDYPTHLPTKQQHESEEWIKRR
ncbi:MAG: hypothetical protein LBU65_06580 [Planctomycetaceae bacterium]|jgi:lipoate-protein ligase A|nr:hypothetical protein [Planctomycetaceae bacterium]